MKALFKKKNIYIDITFITTPLHEFFVNITNSHTGHNAIVSQLLCATVILIPYSRRGINFSWMQYSCERDFVTGSWFKVMVSVLAEIAKVIF